LGGGFLAGKFSKLGASPAAANALDIQVRKSISCCGTLGRTKNTLGLFTNQLEKSAWTQE